MSALNSLHVRQAQQHVTDFDREAALLRDHREALECWDVDAILQMGVDAFNWLTNADNFCRKALFEGQITSDEALQAEDGLVLMFQAWLRSGQIVNQRISAVAQRGYNLENLAKFRNCEREVQAIVRHYGDNVVAPKHSGEQQLPDALHNLRDDALSDYRNGQTAEFISEDE